MSGLAEPGTLSLRAEEDGRVTLVIAESDYPKKAKAYYKSLLRGERATEPFAAEFVLPGLHTLCMFAKYSADAYGISIDCKE